MFKRSRRKTSKKCRKTSKKCSKKYIDLPYKDYKEMKNTIKLLQQQVNYFTNKEKLKIIDDVVLVTDLAKLVMDW